jgi:hypothetical protein
MSARRAAVATVVALLRARLGQPEALAGLPPDPPWEEAVEVASAGLVLPALAEGARRLPGGLASLGEAGRFLEAMEQSNAARNRRLLQRLDEATAALTAHAIPCVALKGAVFALEEPDGAPWRFLGDLDLLVPAERAAEARDALRHLGYGDGGVPDLGDELHHGPPLLHPDGETIVEVHTRLFAVAGNEVLPAERMLATARCPAAGRPQVGVPPATERLVHLAAHAQLAGRRWERRSVGLRDALDFVALAIDGRADLEAARSRFNAAGHEPAFAGFVAAMARLIGPVFPPPRFAEAGAAWAEDALAALHAPGRLKRRLAAEWLGHHTGRLLTAEGRRRAWRTVADPALRRQFLARKLFGWRSIR